MLPASKAVVKRSTSSSSSREPGSGACSRWLGGATVSRALRALQRSVHGDFGDAEHLGDLARAEGEHVAQDEHGALTRGKSLQPGNEREPDRLSRFVSSLGLL